MRMNIVEEVRRNGSSAGEDVIEGEFVEVEAREAGAVDPPS